MSSRLLHVTLFGIVLVLALACSEGGDTSGTSGSSGSGGSSTNSASGGSGGSGGGSPPGANGAPTISITKNGTFYGTLIADGDVAEHSSGVASVVIQESVDFSSDVDIDAAAYLGSGNIIFSTESSFTEGGTTYLPHSLVEYDVATGALSLYFDGSAHFDVGTHTIEKNIDAIDVLSNGNLALSTWTSAGLSGSPLFTMGDVVEYDPSTSTIVGILFSANALEAAGNYTGNKQIDAVEILGTDLFAISVEGAATIFGTAIADGDIAIVDLAAGTATVAWAEGVMFVRDEDIDAILTVR